MNKNKYAIYENLMARISGIVRRALNEAKETQEDIDFNELCMDKDIDDAQSSLEHIGNVKFVDEKIDDGISPEDDENEAVYLMVRCFDVTIDGTTYYVKLYYPSDTYKVEDIEVS